MRFCGNRKQETGRQGQTPGVWCLNGSVVRCGPLFEHTFLACTLRGFDASESIPSLLHASGRQAGRACGGLALRIGFNSEKNTIYTSAQEYSINQILAQVFATSLVSFKEAGVTAKLCCHCSE